MSEMPKLIAVTGPTGAGKSTFINWVCGSKLDVGQGLRSCTSQVQTAQCELEGQKIVMIDTPGFDDSSRSQADILKEIAEFLGITYKRGTILSGLIYMHRISENRVGGIARENFRLFSKICGEDAMRNVLIVTTMWEAVPEEVGARREQELASKSLFFKDAIDHGSRMVRHYNTPESARQTMRTCLENLPRVLQMQHEVVDEHKELPQTAAGMELQNELERQAEQHRQKMQQLREELEAELARKDAKHQEDVDAIKRAFSDLEFKMKKVEKELKKLTLENKISRGEKNGRWKRLRLGMGFGFPGAPDIVILTEDKSWQCSIQ